MRWIQARRRPARPAAHRPARPSRLPAKAYLLWALGSICPKLDDRIVVFSIPDWEDGALAALAELRRRGRRPTALLEEVSPPPDQALRGVRRLKKNSLRGRWHYLTAEYVVFTHCPYTPHPPFRGQVLINIWHGEGTKPVGRFDGQAPVPCTWITTTSLIGRAFRCAEMGVSPSQVLIVGAPRNDRLLEAGRDEVRARIGVTDHEQRWLLWLPTYRSSAVSGRIDGDAGGRPLVFSDADLQALGQWLAQHDTRVLVKLHPQATKGVRFSPPPAITLIDEAWMHARGLSLYQLLRGVDGLITDVSSVWIDFLLLDKPVIFAFPDVAQYRSTRGFMFEPYEDWIVGPLAETVDELVGALAVIGDGPDRFSTTRHEWRDRVHVHQDGHSASRLLDAVGL